MSDDRFIGYGKPVPDPVDLVVSDGVAFAVPPAPPGWTIVPTDTDPRGYIYRPDASHPLYPYNAAIREKPQYERWLDTDPDIADYVDENRLRFRAIAGELWRRSHHLTPTALKGEIALVAARIATEIERAVARGLGRRDLPRWLVAEYLVRQLIPTNIEPELIRTRLSVAIYADSRGTIVLSFTAASASHRAYWEPLIRSFQEAFDFRGDPGGRPVEGIDDIAAVVKALRAGDEKVTLDRVAAQLYQHAKDPSSSLKKRVKTLRERGTVKSWGDLVARIDR